jgi:hypothetical protein
MESLSRLGPFDKESGSVNATIDTPKGSRKKFEFDEKTGLFKLSGTLPVGSVFPFDLDTFLRRKVMTVIHSTFSFSWTSPRSPVVL